MIIMKKTILTIAIIVITIVLAVALQFGLAYILVKLAAWCFGFTIKLRYVWLVFAVISVVHLITRKEGKN
jgi:hypothetical protein